MRALVNALVRAATVWPAIAAAALLLGPPADAATPAGLQLSDLNQATYQGLVDGRKRITLKDGRWVGPPFEPGSASRPQAVLVQELLALGDLNGDGQDEAAVLLEVDSGGSGTFLHLAVMARLAAHQPIRQVASVLLGDRLGVRALRIERRHVLLDVVRAGPQDPACCPGELATLAWKLERGKLRTQPSPVPPARLGLAALGERTWVLKAWQPGEALPAGVEVTVSHQGGRLVGTSGCNRYSAEVKGSLQGPELQVGPPAGTRMACEGEAARTETRFLQQLQQVNRLGFQHGDLRLDWAGGNEGGVMRFQAR